MKRIVPNQLILGQPIPQDLYDREGIRLASRGDIIKTNDLLGFLQKNGRVRDDLSPSLPKVLPAVTADDHHRHIDTSHTPPLHFNQDAVVLVADDQELARSLLDKLLRTIGFRTIHTVSDGAWALQTFTNLHPALLFLDIEMPRINGLEVLRRIRETDTKTFITIVSAHSTVGNVKQALATGANSFVVKPYNYRKVEDVVKKWILTGPPDQSNIP
ncbi:putative Response regulator receiver domain-containing protein [Gammaproteobacteria bacterium]